MVSTNTGSTPKPKGTKEEEPRKRGTYIEPGGDAAPAEMPEFLKSEESKPTIAEQKAERATLKAVSAPPVAARDSVIARAQSLISTERSEEYGDAQLSFERISDIWSTILGVRVTEKQVALMMAGLKIARLAYDPDNQDSWVDVIGYAALGAEVNETEVLRQTVTEL